MVMIEQIESTAGIESVFLLMHMKRSQLRWRFMHCQEKEFKEKTSYFHSLGELKT